MKALFNGARWILGGRSAAAATVQTFAAKLLNLAANLATGIITARVLGPTGRGEQAAMLMWPGFLAGVMILGLPVALLYNLKRYPDEKSQLFSGALLMGTALGLLATFTGVVFIPVWLAQYSTEVIHLSQWLMLTAPIGVLGVTFSAALEAQDDFTSANQLYTLPPLITLATLGVLALTGTLTPFTSSLAYIVPNLPIVLWMLTRLWRLYRPRWRGIGTSCKRLIYYGVRSYGIDLLGTLAGQVDQVLVVGFLPPASMGMYVVALSMSRMLGVFESSIGTVLFPKAAARPIEEVVALTERAARVGTAITFLVGLAVMLLGPVILQLFYGSKFIGAIPVFRILIVQVVLNGATSTLAQAFMAVGRPGTVTILQGIGLGINFPLMLILIPTYGLVGAGFALLCSTIVRLIFVMVSYRVILKVRSPSLLITREDLYFVQQKLFKER
jgi:O-antigen/teichoic acid export membrane protein